MNLIFTMERDYFENWNLYPKHFRSFFEAQCREARDFIRMT